MRKENEGKKNSNILNLRRSYIVVLVGVKLNTRPYKTRYNLSLRKYLQSKIRSTLTGGCEVRKMRRAEETKERGEDIPSLEE
jgi:hypothetical protein